MSADESEGRPRRELAHRMFATEFDDADLSFAESDEERAPNYVVTPTGARANRLFVTGVLTERERLESDQIRARIADPTGVFVVYAGQYQPDALAALDGLSVPSFVAVTGKARTFQPEDSDRVFTSVRPETITEIDADTRDRWIVETAGRTLDRIEAFEAALADGQPGSSEPDPTSGIALAREHYGTTPAYLDALRGVALDATESVAGENEALAEVTLSPGEGSDREVDDPVRASLDGRTVVAVAGSGADDAAGESAPTASADSDNPAADPIDDRAEPEPTSEAASESGGADPGDENRIPTPEDESASEDSVPGESNFHDDELADDGASFEETTSPGDPTGDEETGPSDSGIDDDNESAGPEAGTAAEEPGDEPAITEEERAAVEAEFDTGFTSGSEVDDAGEAGIEPEAETIGDDADPESAPNETVSSPAADSEPVGSSDADGMPAVDGQSQPEADGTETLDSAPSAVDSTATDDPTSSEAIDAIETVMDAMRDLDDGDGADHGAIVERAVENGASEADAEEALQDALMGGRCYEAGDDVYKAI